MALSASVVGGPLKSMLDMRDICAGKIKPGEAQYPGPQGFRGTAAELLAELNGFLSTQGKRPPKHWPETPRGMSAALRRIAPALRRIEYRVDVSRQGRGNDQHRAITIETPNFSFSTRFAQVAGDHRSHRSHRSHPSAADPAEAAPARDKPRGNDGNGVPNSDMRKHIRESGNGVPCDVPGCQHGAWLTGPAGNWCAEHLEPWQRTPAGFLTCATCNGLFPSSARGLRPEQRCPDCRRAHRSPELEPRD